MGSDSIWMTPEEFVLRFEINPSLLGSVLEFRSKLNFERSTVVTNHLRNGRRISAKVLLRWYEVSWLFEIAGVAGRHEYASQFDDEYGDDSDPIVDKRFELVFRLHDAGHTFVMGVLYYAHHGWTEASLSERDPQVAYLLEGYGYFRSSVLFKFMVGKKLFEADQLDQYDEAIIAGSLTMVSDRRSFLAIKSSYGY
jgi:hypothetical protein